MAGKRQSAARDEPPQKKPRITKGVRNNNKKDSRLVTISAAKTKGRKTATPSPEVIDLESEGYGFKQSVPVVLPKHVMKPLPPFMLSDIFPRFDDGEIYIIIDPENLKYQYRLHKTILLRLSTTFASLLSYVVREPDPKLKSSETTAAFRFDLTYIPQTRRWKLSKKAFTTLREAPATPDTNSRQVAQASPPSCKTLAYVGSGSSLKVMSNQDVGGIPAIPSPPRSLDPTSIEIQVLQIDTAQATQSSSTIKEEDGQAPVSPEVAIKIEEAPLVAPLDNDEVIGPDLNISQSESIKNSGEETLSDNIQHYSIAEKEVGSSTTDLSMENSSNISDDMDMSAQMAQNDDTKVEENVKSEDKALGDQSSLIEDRNSAAESISEVTTAITSPESEAAPLENKEQNAIVKADNSSTPKTSLEATDVVHTLTDRNLPEVETLKAIVPSKPVIPTRPPIEICEAYNNVFRIFYNEKPLISNDSISVALGQCEIVLGLAVELSALHIVRPWLSDALSQFGMGLYVAIVEDPRLWLKLSIKLESAAIFREAIIHIVGQAREEQDEGLAYAELCVFVPDAVSRLLVQKTRELYLWRRQVNEHLLLLTTQINLDTSPLSPDDLPAFPTWLVVQAWRDWFCDQLAKYEDSPSTVAKFYRSMGRSRSPAFSDEFRSLLAASGWSTLLDDLESKNAWKTLKKSTRVAVELLCENHSMINVEAAGIDYLTCTRVENHELPWVKATAKD